MSRTIIYQQSDEDTIQPFEKVDSFEENSIPSDCCPSIKEKETNTTVIEECSTMDIHSKFASVSKTELESFIRTKIKRIFGETLSKIELATFKHGLIFSELPKQNTIRYLVNISCNFCDHVPMNPYKCENCKLFFCHYCTKLLFYVFNKRNGNPSPNFDDIVGRRFDCVSCHQSGLSKIQNINSDETTILSEYMVHCRNFECPEKGKYYDIVKHLGTCDSDNYKVNSILHFIKDNKEMLLQNDKVAVIPPLEDPDNPKSIPDFTKAFDIRCMAQFPNLVRLGYLKRKRSDDDQGNKRLRTDEPKQSTSKSTLDPLYDQQEEVLIYSQEPEATTIEVEENPEWENQNEPAIAAKVSVQSIDWRSVLDDEEVTPSTTRPEPRSINEKAGPGETAIGARTNLKRSIDDIKNDPKLTGKQKRALIRRRKQWEKEKELGIERKQDVRRRDKRLEWLLNHSNPNQVFSLTNNIHKERLVKTIRKLTKDKIKVCGLDIEKAEVLTQLGPRQLPIWIGIVDQYGAQLINEIVRYPKDAIKLGTIFHGITFELTLGCDHWANVKRKVIAVLKEQDIICVAGGVTDFISMGFSYDDWELIRPKIRDVNTYYRCIYDTTMISLKFITFCLFGQIIQENEHSPIVDAGFTMWAYLLDQEEFEKAQNAAISHPEYKKPYPHVNYGYNRQMSQLIRKIMARIGDWPWELRKRPMGKPAPSYNENRLCDGALELRPPFSEIKLEIFDKFKAKNRPTRRR